MKLFSKASDGGKDSGVTGFFFVEIKPLFSVVLLRFRNGTREAFHSHAFNAWTFWLSGRVREHRLDDPRIPRAVTVREYRAGLKPKYTPRENHHKVQSIGVSYALSFRGPWAKTWREYRPGVGFVTLTNGRKVVDEN
jgi:hypothetical protein